MSDLVTGPLKTAFPLSPGSENGSIPAVWGDFN